MLPLRLKTRADVGAELIHAWDQLETLIVRCGEVATGQEFREDVQYRGASTRTFGTLFTAIAHAERAGYFKWDEIRPWLSVRNDYLTAKHPDTAQMRRAVHALHEWDRRLRVRLGPLAPEPVPVPPRPKPL